MDFRTHFSSSESSLLLSSNECNLLIASTLGSYVRFYIWISNILKRQKEWTKATMDTNFLLKYRMWYDTRTYAASITATHPTTTFTKVHSTHIQYPFHIKFVFCGIQFKLSNESIHCHIVGAFVDWTLDSEFSGYRFCEMDCRFHWVRLFC